VEVSGSALGFSPGGSRVLFERLSGEKQGRRAVPDTSTPTPPAARSRHIESFGSEAEKLPSKEGLLRAWRVEL